VSRPHLHQAQLQIKIIFVAASHCYLIDTEKKRRNEEGESMKKPQTEWNELWELRHASWKLNKK